MLTSLKSGNHRVHGSMIKFERGKSFSPLSVSLSRCGNKEWRFVMRQSSKVNWASFLIIAGLIGSCSDGNEESRSKAISNNNHDSFQQQDTSSNKFPTGTFKAKDIILEPTGQPTFHANEMDLFDVVAEIARIDSDKISIKVSAQLRQTSAGPTKNDTRVDIYRVQWSDDKSGKLVNRDAAHPIVDFTIDSGELTIRAWVARNNAFETQIYALSEDSVFYEVNTQEWLRHGTPNGEVFTCKPCSEQVQIQISVGPEIPSDALFTNNSEFIDSLSTEEAQNDFAKSLIQRSVPGKFEIDIYRTSISSLGGLEVLQFGATVEVGPLLSYDTTTIALHRNRIIKISLNYLDGAMNEETSQIISRFFESFRFV